MSNIVNKDNKLADLAALAKRALLRDRVLRPTLIVQGTAGVETAPLPYLPEPIKLSLLEGLGCTIAADNRVGDLVHVAFLCEGWRSNRQGGELAALRPEHDPDRVEVVLVTRYDAADRTLRLVFYDILRDAGGALARSASTASNSASARRSKQAWRTARKERSGANGSGLSMARMVPPPTGPGHPRPVAPTFGLNHKLREFPGRGA